MIVKMTQFIPPRGHQEIREVEVSNDCAVGYEALTRKGCRLTIERLMTGHISMCIEHEEGDYDLVLVPRSALSRASQVDVLERMIKSFNSMKFDTWLDDVKGTDTTLIKAGVVSVDEVRQQHGLDPLSKKE